MQTYSSRIHWLSLCLFLGSVLTVQAQGTNQVAAVVNGTQIPVSMVDDLLRTERPPPQPIPEAQKKEMRRMALDMIINDVLMRQYLAQAAPQVTEKDVDKELTVLMQALAEKKVSMDKFLADTKQTMKELREDILAKLQWEAYVKAALPETELQKYYEANKVFFDKVFVKASHILVKVDDKATAADKQAARYKAQQIREVVLKNQITFENAAKAYSDCPSKDKGGDIGLFPYKFAVAEPFARAAFSMQVGQISDVIETGFGFHVIKVTERRKGEPSTFEGTRDIIRDVYAQDLQLHQRILQDQRNKAKIQVYLQ